MVASRFVALLRGINVGGNNLIKMTALKAAIEGLGFENVATYIASGNVIFTGAGRVAQLEKTIEAALSKTFRYESRVLVRSKVQMEKVLYGAPKDWPRSDLRCYIAFLKAPLTTKAALAQTRPKPGVDTVTTGPSVLYLGSRKDMLTKSGLNKIASTPAYQSMTIRTYGTCAKILELMDR